MQIKNIEGNYNKRKGHSVPRNTVMVFLWRSALDYLPSVGAIASQRVRLINCTYPAVATNELLHCAALHYTALLRFCACRSRCDGSSRGASEVVRLRKNYPQSIGHGGDTGNGTKWITCHQVCHHAVTKSVTTLSPCHHIGTSKHEPLRHRNEYPPRVVSGDWRGMTRSADCG